MRSGFCRDRWRANEGSGRGIQIAMREFVSDWGREVQGERFRFCRQLPSQGDIRRDKVLPRLFLAAESARVSAPRLLDPLALFSQLQSRGRMFGKGPEGLDRIKMAER